MPNNREDLTDLMTALHPQETPVFSMINKGKATGLLHEWNVDSFDNPSTGGSLEGRDVSSFTDQTDAVDRCGNRIQKFQETYMVSREQELVSTAGIKNDVAYSKAKALKQLKLNIESTICSDNARVAATASVAGKLAGLGDIINASGPTGWTELASTYRTPSNSIVTTATASLTEASLQGALQSIYEQGGSQNLKFVVGPTLKRKITDFMRAEGSTTSTPFQVSTPQTSREIVLNVKRYEGDFGVVDIIPSMYLARTDGAAIADAGRQRGYLLDPSLVGIAELSPIKEYAIDDEGAGKRGYYEAMLTLVVKNPLGLGKFKPA